MSRRRGLALVMTLLASATVATSAAAATATATGSTSNKICVALVVDGRALGSDVSTTCAKVTKGATGVQVLQAGGHTVGFRDDGLLCTIDGLPKGGCATVDDTHYWAYFHRAPGTTKWVYSSEGASTYQPVNRSTEGWVYDDGKALTPQNVPYAAICKTAATPTPTPTRTPTRTPRRTPTPSPSASPTRTAATPIASTPTHRPSSATTLHRHRHQHSSPPQHHHSTPVQSPDPGPSTTSAALTGAVTPTTSHNGRLDLLVGLIVVAVLGIAAAARFRRSPR